VAHPDFAQRFPGGIIQFALLASQLPEDALEDLMIAEANGTGARDLNAGIPGQFQGEMGALDFEPGVPQEVRDGNDDEEDIEVRGCERSSGGFSEPASVPHDSPSRLESCEIWQIASSVLGL
jgi:hypothetical protein